MLTTTSVKKLLFNPLPEQVNLPVPAITDRPTTLVQIIAQTGYREFFKWSKPYYAVWWPGLHKVTGGTYFPELCKG
jgi:hypothetical protein